MSYAVKVQGLQISADTAEEMAALIDELGKRGHDAQQAHGEHLRRMSPEERVERARAASFARWNKEDSSTVDLFLDPVVTKFFDDRRAALAPLSELYRRICLLRADGTPTSQIATQVGVSTKKVKNVLHQIKTRLENTENNPNAGHKCSKCEKKGHNVRTCGEQKAASAADSPSCLSPPSSPASEPSPVSEGPTVSALRPQAKLRIVRAPANETRHHEQDGLAVEHGPWFEAYARRLAKRYPGLDPDDAAGEAAIGLLHAARTFDAIRGVPFRAWATRRVKGAVIDLHRKGDPAGKYQREMEKAGIETTRSMQGLPRRVDGDLGDIERERKYDFGLPASQLQRAELNEVLGRFDELPPKTAAIMRRHFVDGIGLRVIGESLGVTESRVCQIVKEGQEKLMELLREPVPSAG